ncbi:anti-sigma factor [Bacillus sp. BGMRC 2118]|nr:anti-sigma factor [Bacillus sp. BGMRC 2118]
MKEENNKGKEQDENLYKEFLKGTKQELKSNYSIPEKEQRKIVNRSKNTARTTSVMVSLALILLIIPITTLLSYNYYGFHGKADKLIDITGKTLYVTEPNTSLEEMEIEHEIGFFSMEIFFNTYKRIGKEDYKAGDYSIYFALDKPNFPKEKSNLDRPLTTPLIENERLLHPQANIPFNIKDEWEMLAGLPEGTVSEVYVSFTDVMEPKQLEKLVPSTMEVRWLAIDTGLEEKQVDHEGVPVSAIGYPAQYDPTTWSPFKSQDQTNVEVFIDILKLLEKNEEVAEQISRHKSLELKERLNYIETNGINVYGAVITGPTSEILKLKEMQQVRAIKVGEVKLWNWK